uniref:Uncharacterized protein n=1 Tax=Peronospora matthiolae TaxID=2874970 RepID=A0AAV1U9Y0_9STRA
MSVDELGLILKSVVLKKLLVKVLLNSQFVRAIGDYLGSTPIHGQ